jgi:hypothetical protein
VRLTRALPRVVSLPVRAIGRLCLAECDVGEAAALAEAVRGMAPLVIDVADSSEATLGASLADAVVIVGAPDGEPALAAVLSRSLTRIAAEPVVVLNRDGDGAVRWDGRCAARLPDSRLGAQLALAGREPRGDLGAAVAKLCDLVVPPV